MTAGPALWAITLEYLWLMERQREAALGIRHASGKNTVGAKIKVGMTAFFAPHRQKWAFYSCSARWTPLQGSIYILAGTRFVCEICNTMKESFGYLHRSFIFFMSSPCSHSPGSYDTLSFLLCRLGPFYLLLILLVIWSNGWPQFPIGSDWRSEQAFDLLKESQYFHIRVS